MQRENQAKGCPSVHPPRENNFGPHLHSLAFCHHPVGWGCCDEETTSTEGFKKTKLISTPQKKINGNGELPT